MTDQLSSPPFEVHAIVAQDRCRVGEVRRVRALVPPGWRHRLLVTMLPERLLGRLQIVSRTLICLLRESIPLDTGHGLPGVQV